MIKTNLHLKFLVLFIGLSFMNIACSQNNETRIENEPEIIIYEKITLGCLPIRESATESEYVIQNKEVYQQLWKLGHNNHPQHPDCASYIPPILDFSHFTLIGYRTIIGGNRAPVIECQIIKYNKNTYSVDISIEQQGRYSLGIPIELWYLIPKISQDSDVKFNVIETIKE